MSKRAHVLSLAANCLADDKRNPLLIADVRLIAESCRREDNDQVFDWAAIKAAAG